MTPVARYLAAERERLLQKMDDGRSMREPRTYAEAERLIAGNRCTIADARISLQFHELSAEEMVGLYGDAHAAVTTLVDLPLQSLSLDARIPVAWPAALSLATEEGPLLLVTGQPGLDAYVLLSLAIGKSYARRLTPPHKESFAELPEEWQLRLEGAPAYLAFVAASRRDLHLGHNLHETLLTHHLVEGARPPTAAGRRAWAAYRGLHAFRHLAWTMGSHRALDMGLHERVLLDAWRESMDR